MARSDGKPSGWRFLSERFWSRGAERMCKMCRKVSLQHDNEAGSHERNCAHAVIGTVVRGPDLPPPPPRREHPIDEALRNYREPIQKQGKPDVSDTYRQWVKSQPCCNCGAPAPSDPHHEDVTIPLLKRGKGMKARDQLCVPLCRRCHDSLEAVGGGYRLPCFVAGASKHHERAETLAILHDAQVETLRLAYSLLPQEWVIEALSAGLAKVPEGVLKASLKADAEDEI